MDLRGILKVVNLSDRGRVRPHNEDSSASDPSLGALVVADGMGGYRAGEVASAIAVTSIISYLRNGMQYLKPSQIDESTGYSKESLLIKRAIMAANALIFRTAQTQAQCHGMGTTVLACLFYDDQVAIAHVGDSRLYRLRGDTFEQLTSDHSLMQELIDRGIFTPEQAAANAPKHLLTRALGIDETVEIDLKEETVQPRDTYLLCTDGLSDMVNDEDIYLILCKHRANLMKAAQELIAIANENGGTDNISVVLAQPLAHFPARFAWFSKLFR